MGPAVAALRNGHTEALLSGAVDELSERILTDNVMAGLLSKDGTPQFKAPKKISEPELV